MPWLAQAPHAGFSTATPWLPIPSGHHALAVDAQRTDPHSTLNIARQLIALRRAHAALREGDFETLHVDDALLVARRHCRGDAVQLAFNLGDASRESLALEGRVVFALSGARLVNTTLHLPPWSCLITTTP
jgi:alpha-glucosidase